MGLLVTAAYTVLIVLSNKWLKIQSNLEPPGFDFAALTPEELSGRRYGSKLVIVVEQMQIIVIWSCKACLLIMYHRLTRQALRNENIAIKLLAAYVALGFIVMEILYFAAWCRPFSEYYAIPTTSHQCNALVSHRITKAVFNLSSDLIMLVIALQMLIRSLLPLKRKLILCGIFSLGVFVIAASVMNSYSSFKNPYRQIWIYWYVRESSTAILVANLPFTWTILRKFFELGDFDTNSPPPWTYHSSRTAGGRKTAQLLHQQNGHSTAQTRQPHSQATSKGSQGTTSMTLVGTPSTVKEKSLFPTSSPHNSENDQDLLDEAIRPHDFASMPSPTGNDDVIDRDLELGVMEKAHLRPPTPGHLAQQQMLTPVPPKITEDGTGGFYVNNRPISPPTRAQLMASANRSREPSLHSVDRRPMSPTPSYTGSAVDGSARRGSATSAVIAPAGNVGGGGTAGGGRSARDRRARARMSRESNA